VPERAGVLGTSVDSVETDSVLEGLAAVFGHQVQTAFQAETGRGFMRDEIRTCLFRYTPLCQTLQADHEHEDRRKEENRQHS
jgi:hypothetical protein